MAFGDYRLTINGVTKTLREWGVTECSLRLQALKGDMLTFEVPVLSLEDDAAILSREQKVQLLRPAGSPTPYLFCGYAEEPMPVISHTEQKRIYRVPGGDALLAGAPYVQHWRFPAEIPSDYITADAEKEEALVSLVTLFREYAGGTKITSRQQIVDGLTQASTYASDAGRSFTYDDTANLPNILPPEDMKRDLTCLQVEEAVLRWSPHVTAWMDYSSGEAKRRYARVQVADALGVPYATPLFFGTGFMNRVVHPSQTTAISARPLNERLVKEVEINYLIVNQIPSGGKTLIYRSTHRDTSTISNAAYPKSTMTVDMRGISWDGSQYQAPEVKPPDGLAAQLHQAFGRVFWEFQIEFTDESPRFGLKIGEGWKVTGIGVDTGYSVAQSIFFDLRTGKTVVQTGAQNHLGYDDRAALLLPNKLRTRADQAGDQTYGMGDSEKKNEDSDGMTRTKFNGTNAGGEPAAWWIKAQETLPDP